MAATETSRSFLIHLPPETASKVEELAQRENRSMDDLFGEAVNLYAARLSRQQQLDAFSERSMQRHPQYVEDDISRLIQEVRANDRG